MNLPQKVFKRYMRGFNKCTDEEIIESFNKEVDKGGWGYSQSKLSWCITRTIKYQKFRLFRNW